MEIAHCWASVKFLWFAILGEISLNFQELFGLFWNFYSILASLGAKNHLKMGCEQQENRKIQKI